jgi:F-type H+-transporting ATPase subunit delta
MKSTRRTRRAARQLYRLCVVDGLLDPDRVRNVAARVARSQRRGRLDILTAFQRLVRLDRARHSAVIESATPLAGDVRTEVHDGLTRLYGAGLETTFGENPALIGGMRVKVGSDVYDSSVRARLAALEARL